MSSRIKTWTFKFKGHYPVGACGVVSAESIATAIIWAEKELESIGLPQRLHPKDFTPLPTGHRHVRILVDGDY